MLRTHFPLALLAANGLSLAIGDYALCVICMAAAIAAMPLVYGRDVDEIVEATVGRIGRG